MASLTIHRLAKLIQSLDQHPRLKDLVIKKRHTVVMPEIGHELYTKLFIIFVGCNDLLLERYATANWATYSS